MNISEELVTGTFWTAVGRYSNYGLYLLVTAILARLLDPSDFGILSMVLVYTGFVNILAEAGISSTVIQKRNLSDKDLSTVFWFSGFAAITLVLITLAIASYIELFFKLPGLALVIKVMSLLFVFLGLSAVPEGKLRRDLQFKRIALVDALSGLLAGIVAVSLALLGATYWALVFQILTMYTLKLLFIFIASRWLPSLQFDLTVIKNILPFSAYVMNFNFINYWARHADNLLIGRFLGAAQLGFYDQAYKLMMLPVQGITFVVTPALHPVLSSIQDHKPSMLDTYLRVLEYIALVSFPLGIYLHIYAGPVIITVFGLKWVKSILVFKVLALLTIVQPIISTTGTIFMATNNAKLLFKLGLVNSLIMILGFALGLKYGILGVAVGYALAFYVFVTPVTLFFLTRTLDTNFTFLFKQLLKPILIGLIFLIALLILKTLTISIKSPVVIVLFSLLFSLMVMLVCITIFYRSLVSICFEKASRVLQ